MERRRTRFDSCNFITEELKVEGALRSEITIEHQAFDGHRLLPWCCVTDTGLPVRGQRTKNNSRTRKGQT